MGGDLLLYFVPNGPLDTMQLFYYEETAKMLQGVNPLQFTISGVAGTVAMMLALVGYYQIYQFLKPVAPKASNNRMYTVYRSGSDFCRTSEGVTFFLTEEYMCPLEEYCCKNDLPLKTVIQIALDICDALDYCWGEGVAHLDVQPGNIYVTSRGSDRLGDFSSSLMLNELATERMIRGTPAYMAPEVHSGMLYSQCSEIYSLGLVIYSLLHDGLVPNGDRYPLSEAVEMRMNGYPVKCCGSPLQEIVEKACAFHPGDRYQSFWEMREALTALIPAPGIPSFSPFSSNGFTPPAPAIPVQPAPVPATGTDFRESNINDADFCGFTTVLAPGNMSAPAPFVPPSSAPAPFFQFDVQPSAPVGSAGDTIPVTEPVRMDQVQFSAVAPASVTEGEYAVIQLFMYEQAFRSCVDEAIQSAISPMQEKRTGFFTVENQTRVKIVLSSPDAEILEDTAEQIWSGKYLSFDFALELPEKIDKKQILLKASVYFNDIPATRLLMIMKTKSADRQPLKISRHDIFSAFVSYASQDRSRVGALVQGMQKARPDLDIFFDVVSMRSGDDWESTLRNEIHSRDLLYLCWSNNARQSEWVDKEWRYALDQKGLEGIAPIPIEPPDVCPPPEELKCKHFNDSILYIINRM